MLSRRLESGLSTDELRTILCRVTMRNTRFTWGWGRSGARLGGVPWGPPPPSVNSCPSLSLNAPFFWASSADVPDLRCLRTGNNCLLMWLLVVGGQGSQPDTGRGSNHSSWMNGLWYRSFTDPLCSCPLSWLLSFDGFQTSPLRAWVEWGWGSRVKATLCEGGRPSTVGTTFPLTTITKETGPMKLQMK